MTLSNEQKQFITTLKKTLGVVTVALQQEGITREDYQEWLDNPFFSNEVDKVSESSLDYVENQLMSLIKEGNLSAIQYYLKTKGKDRGYG